MARTCEYPGCKTTLSNRVPLQITFCGEHQYQLKKLKEKLALENLPRKDILFISRHPIGCNANQLTVHLGLPPTTVIGYLIKGVIKGTKNEKLGVWCIPVQEIKRVIILIRNWITVAQAAKLAGVSDVALLSYVRQGYFGKVQRYLSGDLAIGRDQLPQLKERFETIKRAKQNAKNWLRMKKSLQEEEMIVSEITKIAGVTPETVYLWMRRGWLPSKQRKWWWYIVDRRDFIDFARRAVAGEYPLKPHTIKALRQFLSQ